jgi:hypothetical protein
MQSLILPAKEAHRVLEICISMIVQSRKPQWMNQLQERNNNIYIYIPPSLQGKALCLPSVLFCPDNVPPSVHQTLVVAYDSRNDDLYSYFHIKDDKVIKIT